MAKIGPQGLVPVLQAHQRVPLFPDSAYSIPTAGLTPSEKKFLMAFPMTGNITAAAILAQVDRSIHYLGMAKEPIPPATESAYRRAWAVAKDVGNDYLRTLHRDRAINGIMQVVTYKGQVVTVLDPLTNKEVPLYEQRPSDELLKLLLRTHMPEEYAEATRTDVTVYEGDAVTHDKNVDSNMKGTCKYLEKQQQGPPQEAAP